MALTRFQRDVCRLLAESRIASGESYVAGGVALNELLAAPRLSRDVDVFHGSRLDNGATSRRRARLPDELGCTLHEGTKVRWSVARRVVHAGHVEAPVGMGHEIAEASSLGEAAGQRRIDEPSARKAREGVGIRRGSPEILLYAERDGNVDDRLYGLPKIQDDGIGHVGCRQQLVGVRRQTVGYPREMPFDSAHALGQDLTIEPGH